jgi:Stress responsive A/B Barrel Domain
MRTFRIGALMLAVGIGVGLLTNRPTTAAPAAEPMIGHMVYFTLKDGSDAKARDLVAACDKYLSKHPGEVYYSAGVRGKAFDREVNVKDWDVALHLVFKTKADHDKYAVAQRHQQFIDENKANWKQVRVFDSEIAGR